MPRFFDILHECFKLYKKGAGAYLKLVVLSIASAACVILIGVLLGALGGMGLNMLGIPSGLVSTIFFAMVAISVLALVYLQTWFQIGFLVTTRNLDSGKDTAVMSTLMQNKSKVLGLWITGLLSGFIVFGGFWLLIIPAIVLALWFSLASYIVVFENVRGMNALLKSRDYIKGNTLKVFLYYFGLQVVIFLIQFIPGWILSQTDFAMIASIYSFIIQLFLIPFSVIFTYQLYKHLKEGKSDAKDTYSQSRKNKYLVIGFVTPVIALIVFLGSIWLRSAVMDSLMPFPTTQPLEDDYEEVEDTISLDTTYRYL